MIDDEMMEEFNIEEYPILYVGAVSLNTVAAVCKSVEEDFTAVGLIPSRRQVDYSGGYISELNTESFFHYVRFMSPHTILCRDHAGPFQGIKADNGVKSLKVDASYMDIIHIDPWRMATNFKEGVEATIGYIKTCFRTNEYPMFEVGTEEAIFKYTPDQLREFLISLKKNLTSLEYDSVFSACIQSGVGLDLYNSKNIGNFSERSFLDFIDVCNEFDMVSKEHNGDFLTNEQIKWRFENGLNAINIAPEMGKIESKIYWDSIIEEEKFELLNSFFELVVNKANWKKWVSNDFSFDAINKEKFTTAFGHYVFNTPEFKNIKKQLKIRDVEVVNELKDYITEKYNETKENSF